ncbi:MAG: transporter substrate-binding domain-containing protein [Rhodospirillaceae bacterium]|nr:transporter substrate-binding domain-containing protein [Rhodospirillaceae bacterium]
MTRVVILACLFFALSACATAADTAQTGTRLERIRSKGFLTCGIWPQVAGFALADAKAPGGYSGMDVDACRAVSAAIFGTPDRVKYEIAENVRQLRNTEIDIIARRITWSLTRAATNGLMFGPVTFYDGQGFLVPRDSAITAARQLAGKSVCVASDEAHAATLTSYFHGQGLSVKSVGVDTGMDAERALKAENCVAYSADVSMLGAQRAAMADGYRILPEMISKEPLAPLVHQGDDQFFEIVRWTIFAQIAAEERGLTSENIERVDARGDSETQRFAGLIPGNGAALGLDEKWAVNVIKGVGNYGEMFDRNVGQNSAIKLERGLNRLWTDGGLMYAPRLR